MTTSTSVKKGSRVTGAARKQLAAELAEQYERGATVRGIGASIGRSYGFVHRILTITAGLTLRSRGGNRRARRR